MRSSDAIEDMCEYNPLWCELGNTIQGRMYSTLDQATEIQTSLFM